jgi:hypothetical protein
VLCHAVLYGASEAGSAAQVHATSTSAHEADLAACCRRTCSPQVVSVSLPGQAPHLMEAKEDTRLLQQELGGKAGEVLGGVSGGVWVKESWGVGRYG